MEDVKVVIVHPLEGFVYFRERNVKFTAENNGYTIEKLEEMLQKIFSKYDGYHRAIVLPPKLDSKSNGEYDISLLTTRLHTDEKDVLVSDFTPVESPHIPITWDRVVRAVEEKLDLEPHSKLIVGGFALNDCVTKFAKCAREMGYEVYVDEMITEFFYLYLRLELIGGKTDEQTFYRIEDKDKIFNRRVAELFNTSDG